jgi:hypothetical protein
MLEHCSAITALARDFGEALVLIFLLPFRRPFIVLAMPLAASCRTDLSARRSTASFIFHSQHHQSQQLPAG